MATLKERLSETMKSAMKSGQKDLLAFTRNLHAAIRKKEIDDRIDLDDAGVQKIISSLAKQRQDSIEQFTQGGRADLVAKEQAELQFLQSYLPTQMSDEELDREVQAAIQATQAKSPKDMGAVMKALMPKVQGRADGKRIQSQVQSRLGSSS